MPLLLAVAAASLVLLLFLIIVGKQHAFVALLLVSLILGVAAQYPNVDVGKVLGALQSGMGGTLGAVAIVVGLGSMLGRLLEISGGSQVLARGLLGVFPKSAAAWALAIAGFCISIPVFFDVAFIILVPLLRNLARETGKSILSFAVPLLAGLAVTHAFVPPTPGPVGVAAIIEADLGLVLLYGVMAGLPAMLVAGPLFARVCVRHESFPAPETCALENEEVPPKNPPGVGQVAIVIGLPIVLILLASYSANLPNATGRQLIQLIGHPFVALLLTLLLAVELLGKRTGLSRESLSHQVSNSLEPVGVILLVTGAGGVLKQVMVDTRVGQLLAEYFVSAGAPPLVLAYGAALAIRIMQGSATVAMLTAAGLVLPFLASFDPSPSERALAVVAIAAGGTGFSHVNDSGFWLVGRYLGLSVPETFRTWTVLTTLISITGFATVLLIQQCL